MKWFLLAILSICGLSSYTQVIENPVFDSCNVAAFHIEKIEITKDDTKIYCSYSAKANSWANISKDTYLQDTKTKKQYELIKCDGLPFEPERKVFRYEEKCEITFTFPPVKHGNKIDFIETPGKQAFNIYGVDINKQYDRIYTEAEMIRFSNMASFYDSSGDTLKAIQYKKDEMLAAQYVYGIKSEAYLNALVGLCIMHNSHGNHTEAIKQMELLTKLEEEIHGTSDWQYALQLRTLALFYSNAKMYDKSINTFKESIALYEKLNIAEDQYILALEFISQDYESIGNKKQAIAYQNKAIQARKELGDSENYLRELEAMVISGDSIARIEIVENELKRLPQFVDTTSFAFTKVLKALIVSLDIKREYKRAINYCDRSLSILKQNETDNALRIAEVLALKCKYQQRSGLSYEAISSGEKARCILDTLNVKSIKYAELLGDLAWAYGLNYDFEKSIQLQTNAVTIYEDAKDWISLAEAYNSISSYYNCVLDLDKAEEYIKKAIEVLDTHGDARKYIETEVGLTWNTYIDSSSDAALIQYRIDIDKSNFLQTLARIYEAEGKYANAIIAEKENGINIKSIGDEILYARHLTNLSGYYLKNKQFSDAINCAKLSIQILPESERELKSYALTNLANIYNESGDIINGILCAKQAVSLAVLNSDYDIIARFILSFLYWKNQEYNNAEKCLTKTLDYLKEKIIHDISEMTSEQKQRIWNNYGSLFQLYRSIVTSDNTKGKKANLSKLYNYVLFSKTLLLDAELEGINKSSRMDVEWKDIQKVLSNQDIAIEFISAINSSHENHYYALIIDDICQEPKLISLFEYNELDSVLNHASSPRELGDLIWKKIISLYRDKNNIYFSPDGILHTLSFEYEPVDDIDVLFNSYNMYRLSSTKELLKKNSRSSYNNAFLYGGLNYDMADYKDNHISFNTSIDYNSLRGTLSRGRIEPLENTLIEVNQIQQILRQHNIEATLFTDVHGTEESFRNLQGKNIDILHMATHGMYFLSTEVVKKKDENNFLFLELLKNNTDPVKEDAALSHSFLAMSGCNRLLRHEVLSEGAFDGFLTAKEISQTDLRNTDIVVLAACNSAVGDLNVDGIFGLQRGFKKAGANTILMSLGEVDDEATRILMIEFYRNLVNGKSKLQSLKAALHYLRSTENGKYDKPRNWLQFILLDGLN